MSQKYRNAIPIGQNIGSFIIVKILGQGGFGITYLARDVKLERFVAIKEYYPTEFSKREENYSVYPQSQEDEEVYNWGLDRFLHEGKTLAKFKHPNIVRVIDYLEANNTAYIIMEYEHGRDLQTILKEKKSIGYDETLNIFLPLLEGLSLVHKEGFIHRDIKPANIFIREDGSPVLIDFGSARQGMGTKTKTLTTLVSPGYAPFEQYNADSTIKQGPWTDIYALGACIYKCLFGRSPLDALSRAEERMAGRNDQYLSAAKVGKDHYPLEILEFIDKALEFVAASRPQTINEWMNFLHAVDNYRGQRVDNEDTIKKVSMETPARSYVIKKADESNQVNDKKLKLAITQYIVVGMLTLWSFTAYALSNQLIKYCTNNNKIKIKKNIKYIFSGVYILVLVMILSWVVPNLFMGYILDDVYILNIALISAFIFYVNTLAFILWFMKTIKYLDKSLLDSKIENNSWSEDQILEASNKLIFKWEAIDNKVALFLIISVPIIFSPYIYAKLLFSNISEYLLIALPVIVITLGGIFHMWGTRLLINTYNNVLIR